MRKVTGETERYKACLAAKGCRKKGIDYEELCAPVSYIETIQLLVAAGVEKGWLIDQFDMEMAFLHSSLKEAYGAA